MRKPLLRALGLASFIALLTAGGGYAFSQYAHAQSFPPPSSMTDVEMDAQAAAAWLGLVVAPINERTGKRLDIPQQSGVAVVKVVPDGPAAQAGAQARDVITMVDAASIADMPALRAALQNVLAGNVVQLTVRRPGGTTTVLSVTTTATPVWPGHQRGANPMGGLPFLPGFGGIGPGQGFESSLGGQFSYKDANGQVVTVKSDFGRVKTATDTNVTVILNRGGEATYTISSKTHLRGKGSELKADDRVVAITTGTSNELTALMRVGQFQNRENHSGSSGQKPQADSHRGRVLGFPDPIPSPLWERAVPRLGEFPMFRDPSFPPPFASPLSLWERARVRAL